MDYSFIDDHCANCAAPLCCASQRFSTITVVAETNCSRIKEIPILDAVFYIYRFSAANLASAYLDEEAEEILPSRNKLSETGDYIMKSGISLCNNCVVVFKEVYVAYHQLKKLSTQAAILSKAIKKFAPTYIKVEADDEESKEGIGESESEDTVNPTRRAANTVRFRKTASNKFAFVPAEASEDSALDELFEELDVKKEYDDCESFQEDINPDPFAETKLTNVYALSSFDCLENKSDVLLAEDMPNVPIQKPTVRRGRGRPRKSSSTTMSLYAVSRQDLLKKKSTVKRGRGRPRKYGSTTVSLSAVSSQDLLKKKSIGNRGRPRKSTSTVTIKDATVPHSANRVHLTRRTASLLSSVEPNEQMPDSETLLETEQTEILEKQPTVKRTPSVKQKEAARSNIKAALKRREEKRHRRKKRMQENILGKKILTDDDLFDKGSERASASKPKNVKSKQSSLNNYHNKSRNATPSSVIAKTEEKILKCSCGVAYSTLKSLRSHENESPHEQEPLICDICGTTFMKNYLLYAHKSMEHDEIPEILLKCTFCDAKFLNRNLLKVHVLQHHSSTPYPFVCDKCGKGFSCVEYLRTHTTWVHKDENLDKDLFKCKECGIKLKHSRSLQKHIRVMHRNLKTFICEQCGKTTKNMTNMRIHMKVHDPNRNVKKKTPTETMKSSDSKLLPIGEGLNVML